MVLAIDQYELTLVYMCPLPFEPPSHLPCLPTPLRCCRAPAFGSLSHTSNSHWLSLLHTVMYMFQCYPLKSSHPHLPTLCPNVCRNPCSQRSLKLVRTQLPSGVCWLEANIRLQLERQGVTVWKPSWWNSREASTWWEQWHSCSTSVLQGLSPEGETVGFPSDPALKLPVLAYTAFQSWFSAPS